MVPTHIPILRLLTRLCDELGGSPWPLVPVCWPSTRISHSLLRPTVLSLWFHWKAVVKLYKWLCTNYTQTKYYDLQAPSALPVGLTRLGQVVNSGNRNQPARPINRKHTTSCGSTEVNKFHSAYSSKLSPQRLQRTSRGLSLVETCYC